MIYWYIILENSVFKETEVVTFRERKSRWKISPGVHAGGTSGNGRELEQQLYEVFRKSDKRQSEEAGA